MTNAEVVRVLVEHARACFPKTCPVCQRRFMDVREYSMTTTPVGAFMSYDVDSDRTTPEVGTLALNNCPCGNTLALSTDGLPLETRAGLLRWVRAEATRRGVTHTEVLADLRVRMRALILEGRIEGE